MTFGMMLFGGTSSLSLRGVIQELGAASNVGAVVLDIDSPGGVLEGIAEAAEAIRALREIKPVIAVANTSAASAAYWLGASADQFVASVGGFHGSVGVYRIHLDESQAMEAEGVVETIISAGDNKVEVSNGPLSDDAKEFLQGQVDDAYAMFVKDVAIGRGTTVADVNKNFGQGRAFLGAEAVQRGMADKVGTIESVVQELMGRSAARQQRAARAHNLRAERINHTRAVTAQLNKRSLQCQTN
jgi:signal peptide peptidase SppA